MASQRQRSARPCRRSERTRPSNQPKHPGDFMPSAGFHFFSKRTHRYYYCPHTHTHTKAAGRPAYYTRPAAQRARKDYGGRVHYVGGEPLLF